jgi:hypothetical protein
MQRATLEDILITDIFDHCLVLARRRLVSYSVLVSNMDCTGLAQTAGQVHLHLIGILGQNAGPGRAIWANPVNLTFRMERLEHERC